MREILFRGKRTDNGEWVYGNLVRGCDEVIIKIAENAKDNIVRQITKSKTAKVTLDE